MLSKWIKALIALVIISVPLTSFASIPEIPPVPSQYVVDLAGVIDAAASAQLDNALRELEEKTTVQMVVLTIKSLNGDNLEDFSIRTVEKWKLGQKGKDNGVLLTVSMQDRKYRFEIGYGLERVLPDSLVGSIGRSYLIPNFRKGDYSKGISDASFAVINAIAAEEGVQLTGSRVPAPIYNPIDGKKRHPIGLFHGLVILFFLIVAGICFIRNPGLFLLLFLSSGRGGWGGGGGFGGGSGGFGGGGGGGFGGGGASGDW